MKKSFFFMALIAAAMLTSCGAPAEPEQINVNPSPLTVVGDKVNAEITGTFPAKKFVRKGVLVVTPVLKFNGQEVLGEPITYVGEKVKENGKTVSYRNGGTYSQSVSFDFVPEMAKSELYLRFEARNGKKVEEVPDMKIADGVVATQTLADVAEIKCQITPDKFQRIIQEMQEADIMFLVCQSNLRSSELKSQEMKDLEAAIKEAEANERKAINNLEVSGYASPEGAIDLNTRLANDRQKNAQKFLEKQLKRNKISHAIESTMTAEDWEGFQKAMENSNIQDKELVLRVLSMYSDPEEREAQIKNLASVYTNIAEDILPALRRSRLILTTDLIGKSDDEIMKLMKEDPAQLSVEEMLYAATLTNDPAEKKAIYKKVTEQYPNDLRGWNNLGMCCFEEGNTADARRCFDKALAIDANNADANYNAGIAAMADGDLKKAEAHLGKAAGTKGNLSAAMGTLYTMKGDYAKAKKAYVEPSNNAALQLILNEDYAGARKMLSEIKKPNTVTSYLKAIVGARTNDREAVYTNMEDAMRNRSLKDRVQTDIEFAKFAEDERFQTIIKK